MSSSYTILHLPSMPDRRLVLPFCSDLPRPVGRKLPNGTILVAPESEPALFYKFTPWERSQLAFDEIVNYERVRQVEDRSGIVDLLGISGTRDHVVRVFERSRKGSLGRFLFQETKGDFRLLGSELVRAILARIAAAMRDIHSVDLVHRDLKAENVLVFGDGASAAQPETVRVKLSDFDRAVDLPEGQFLEDPVGSLFHMAPELFVREKYDRKVDVYAFGILMFEVAHSGARPFPGVATGMPGSLSQDEFVREVVDDDLRPQWISEHADLKDLAVRCWAKNPDDRPSFEEIHEILGSAHTAGTPQIAGRKHGDGARPEGVGTASHIGNVRESMEDAVCVVQTSDMLLASIFDGMGGAQASEFSARRFSSALVDDLKNARDEEAAIAGAFEDMDNYLRKIDPVPEGGSTAVVAILRQDELLVSWLGDSPAALFRRSETGDISAMALVDRHQPGREDEAARIAANGGVVRREQRWLDSGEAVPWGPLRVFAPESGRTNGIGVSRALGLFAFKPAIGISPEFIRLERQAGDMFLVLGSDGVFDFLDEERMGEILLTAKSCQQAADEIIQAVRQIGAPDNASVVVIDMRRQAA